MICFHYYGNVCCRVVRVQIRVVHKLDLMLEGNGCLLKIVTGRGHFESLRKSDRSVDSSRSLLLCPPVEEYPASLSFFWRLVLTYF